LHLPSFLLRFTCAFHARPFSVATPQDRPKRFRAEAIFLPLFFFFFFLLFLPHDACPTVSCSIGTIAHIGDGWVLPSFPLFFSPLLLSVGLHNRGQGAHKIVCGQAPLLFISSFCTLQTGAVRELAAVFFLLLFFPLFFLLTSSPRERDLRNVLVLHSCQGGENVFSFSFPFLPFLFTAASSSRARASMRRYRPCGDNALRCRAEGHAPLSFPFFPSFSLFKDGVAIKKHYSS